MYLHKITFILGFLLSSTFLFAQTHTLQGRVSVQNSMYENGKIQYLSKAQVGSNKSKPDQTDYKGRFELSFTGLEKGTPVKVIAGKSGWEVVNKEDLEQVSVGKETPLRIFVAKKGDLAKMQTELYYNSLQALYERNARLQNQLDSTQAVSQGVIFKLEDWLERTIPSRIEAKDLLNERQEDLENNLKEFTRKLVSVNLDFASVNYRRAFEFYKKGKLNRVVEELDEKVLGGSYNSFMKTVQKEKNDPEALTRYIENRTMKLKQIEHSYTLKAIALQQLFRYKEAADTYEKAAKILDIRKGRFEEIEEDVLVAKGEELVPQTSENTKTDTSVNVLPTRQKDNLGNKEQLAAQANSMTAEDSLLAKISENDTLITPSGNPKAITILETPYVSNRPNMANNAVLVNQPLDEKDFENTLFFPSKKSSLPKPIYEADDAPMETFAVATPIKSTTTSTTTVAPNVSSNLKINPPLNNSNQRVMVDSKITTRPANTAPPAMMEVFDIPESQPVKRKKVVVTPSKPKYSKFKITTKTSLRQRPTSSSKVMKRLEVGTKVQVVEQVSKYWCKVIYKGKTGYVKALLLVEAK